VGGFGRGLKRKDAKSAKEEVEMGGWTRERVRAFWVTDFLIWTDCSDFFEGGWKAVREGWPGDHGVDGHADYADWGRALLEFF
jgi:hypothetical protein